MWYQRINRGALPLLIILGGLLLTWGVMASSSDAVWPEATGEQVLSDGGLLLDCSHMSQGYAMAAAAGGSGNRMKLQVVCNGAQLLYDLNSSGVYEVLPFQFGSGTYSISLFENVEGSKYAGKGKIDVSVQLEDENAAFKVPNQYVNYTKESPSVQKSDELAGGKSESEIYEEVCNFMASEFSYDFVRAVSISPGELPEVDGCFESRTGICQDLSAVMISMLRVQGIPSRLMIGYADGYYHAWTVSIVDGEEKFFDPTAAINALNASDYVVERYY